jgi:hypothetical protein
MSIDKLNQEDSRGIRVKKRNWFNNNDLRKERSENVATIDLGLFQAPRGRSVNQNKPQAIKRLKSGYSLSLSGEAL